MFKSKLVLLLFFTALLQVFYISFAQDSEVKILTWTTLEEFENAGWIQNDREEYVNVLNASKPSDVSSSLEVLDIDSENSVWGFWEVDRYMTPEFVLKYNQRPELCGMTSANLTFKYYEYGVGMACYPCDNRPGPTYCGFPFQRYVYWEIQTFNYMLIPPEHSPDEELRIYLGMNSGSIMVFDRIDLNYTVEYRPECNTTYLF